MKLRNKKTGEIYELNEFCLYDDKGFAKRPFLKTLAELNEEWEDVPVEVWYMDGQGVIRSAAKEENDWSMESEIGNCFESKEEAEKAVEKLKAWKRLKDKGFKFDGWGLLEQVGYDSFSYSPQIGFSIPTLDKDEPYAYPEEIERDLDLLFGGEEKGE